MHTVYYLGGLGDKPLPIRLLGGKIVYLPAVGEAFGVKFDDFNYKLLQIATTVQIDGKSLTCVTRDKDKAEKAKRSYLQIPEPKPTESVPTDELLAELQKRGITLAPAPVVEEETNTKKKVTKREQPSVSEEGDS